MSSIYISSFKAKARNQWSETTSIIFSLFFHKHLKHKRNKFKVVM